MSRLKTGSISILSKLAGNKLMQSALQFNVLVSQYLMGIGSGASATASGEAGVFAELLRAVQPPYTIFDVGANQGQFLQLVRSNLEATRYTVHCFEPAAGTFAVLSNQAPQDQRTKLNNFGLGREPSTMTLHYDAVGSGLASLTKRKLDHFGIDFNQSETVEIQTLDDYCEHQGVTSIDLLKVDVEGHELDVFAGARRMFERRAIKMVTFEFGGCNIDTRSFFRDFWYLFQQQQMRLYRITPAGYRFPISAYEEIGEQFRTTNFLAVQAGVSAP